MTSSPSIILSKSSISFGRSSGGAGEAALAFVVGVGVTDGVERTEMIGVPLSWVVEVAALLRSLGREVTDEAMSSNREVAASSLCKR